jgi:hypothetical protein
MLSYYCNYTMAYIGDVCMAVLPDLAIVLIGAGGQGSPLTAEWKLSIGYKPVLFLEAPVPLGVWDVGGAGLRAGRCTPTR